MFSLEAFFVWNKALAVPCCMCFPMAFVDNNDGAEIAKFVGEGYEVWYVDLI